MNINWTSKATEQEFVNYFNEEEKSVILVACEDLVDWDNLHAFDAGTFMTIGCAASIKHLFLNPSAYNTINPFNYTTPLMNVIDYFKFYCADDISEQNLGEDDYMIYLSNTVACCKEMLTQLSNL